MTVNCEGCGAPVEVASREEHTSPFGAVYFSSVMCPTCKILYGNLLERLQDSLRYGRELVEGKKNDAVS